MKNSIENQFIEHLAESLPRSAAQQNTLQQSDAEILRLSPNGPLLALTMDSIAEEIEAGLYTDPYLMGWMTVLVNASDLAAVGAQPLAILISETLRPDLGEDFLNRLQEGIAGAAQACALPVLGGDTNIAGHMELGACAVGLLENGSFLKRTGCRPGDVLYASGPLGLGNAFALRQLQQQSAAINYLPQPRFAQSAVIRRFASCCMDSSDGLIATLDQLMRLNGLGFDLDRPIVACLHADAQQLCRIAGLPPSAMLAGPHGEFELIFTVPPEQNRAFLENAQAIRWQPLALGRAVQNCELRLAVAKGAIKPDTAKIRNMFDERRGDISGYVHELIVYLQQLEKECA